MTEPHGEMLKKLLTGRPKYTVAQVRRFIAYFSSLSDSQFAEECEKMFQARAQAKANITPPAGLKAKQAVPVLLAYVQEELGKPISLSKEERSSFSALVDALDRRFGAGFTERVVKELNALPNGSQSLHYKR